LSDTVLRVNNLDVHYYTDAGIVYANNQVTFDLAANERLGLVGESGSGKSTLALALLRMIKPPGRIAGGEMWLNGAELTRLSEEEMRQLRGREISMIPQGAMNSLNPILRVKEQIMDAMIDHDLGLSQTVLAERAFEALDAVELDARVANMYPHELSGGMKQRVCIAISIAMHPQVIIADEPTSALDVVTQRQVMQTIGRLQERLGSAVILIGHDMGLMAQFVHRMAVMYAGRLVELGTVQDTFTRSLHPYTELLIESLPVLGHRGVFKGIPGITPLLRDLPTGCVFHTRCPKVMDVCRRKVPAFKEYGRHHWAACHLYEQ
jgi:oligopeptide/dipeptide ABC transporter ATP-binding protein